MAVVPDFIPFGDKINSVVSKFLDGFEVGIETIRRVNYAPQYLWVVDFNPKSESRPPAPFDEFFPASDVTFPSAISNNQEILMAQSGIVFPVSSAPKSVDITFYDDEKRTLQKWMSDWINLDIYNNGKFVSGIDDRHDAVDSDSFGVEREVQPKRHIRISFLDKLKNEVLVYNYNVVPNGEVSVLGSQASEATTFSMKFDIVGIEGSEEAKVLQQDGVKKLIKTSLGRFI